MNIRLTKSEKEELVELGYVYIKRFGFDMCIELSEHDERGYSIVILDNIEIVNYKNS